MGMVKVWLGGGGGVVGLVLGLWVLCGGFSEKCDIMVVCISLQCFALQVKIKSQSRLEAAPMFEWLLSS